MEGVSASSRRDPALMSSVTLVRGRLRGHLRAYLGLAVLLGIVGGLSLFAMAGARRVQSEYPKVLAAGRASNLSVASSGGFDPKAAATVAHLPDVESSRAYAGMQSYVMDHGRPELDPVLRSKYVGRRPLLRPGPLHRHQRPDAGSDSCRRGGGERARGDE